MAQAAQAALESWTAALASDWRLAANFVAGLASSGTIAAPDAEQQRALQSLLVKSAAGVCIAPLALSRRGRKLVFDCVETVLASVLIVALLGVVLGLPLGALAPSSPPLPAAHSPVWFAIACTPPHPTFHLRCHRRDRLLGVPGARLLVVRPARRARGGCAAGLAARLAGALTVLVALRLVSCYYHLIQYYPL